MQTSETDKLNWFERHLNLTTIGFGFLSTVILVLFPVVAFGWKFVYPQELNYYSTLIVIIISAIFFFCFIFTVAGYGWILYKKHQSPWLLLLFLPGFIYFYLTIIVKPFSPFSQVFGHISYEVNPSYWLLFVLVLFLGWPILWLILLLLQTTKKPASKFFSVFYNSAKRVTRLLLSLIIIIGLLTISSFFLVKNGYATYRFSPPADWAGVPKLSFSYPLSYSSPVLLTETDSVQSYIHKVHALYLEKTTWEDGVLNLDILTYDSSTTQTLIEKCGSIEKAVIAITKPQLSIEPPQSVLVEKTQVSISGTTAYRLAPSIVYFEYNNCLWIIWEKRNSYENIDYTTSAFSHLLETLKISEN